MLQSVIHTNSLLMNTDNFIFISRLTTLTVLCTSDELLQLAAFRFLNLDLRVEYFYKRLLYAFFLLRSYAIVVNCLIYLQ